jgi:hypothetical protein
MWKRGAALALAALVAACGAPNWPKTPEEFRGLNDAFHSRTTFTVQRSFSDVNASLRTATQKCLNGTQHKMATLPGPYGPTSESRLIAYNTKFDVTGSRGEMTVRLYYPARPRAFGFPEGGRIFYVANTAPQGGGTALTVHRNTVVGVELDAAVREWVSGGAIRCPALPG